VSLNIDILFFPASNFRGEVPTLPSKTVDATLVLQAVETAIAEATEAGFFRAGGYLTVTIQAARKA